MNEPEDENRVTIPDADFAEAVERMEGAPSEMEWSCYASVHGTKFLGTVRARSREDALKKAENLDSANVSVCWHCSKEISDPEIGEISVEVAP